MRKLLLSLLLVLSSLTLSAQLRTVHMNYFGDLLLEVALPKGGYILLDQFGRVSEMSSDGLRVERYSKFHHYEAGKIKSIEGLKFTYYSDFNDYESGRIKSIGDVKFKYHSAYHSYKTGKIQKIGSVAVDYYSDYHDYESGKVKSIGKCKYSYSSNKRDYGALDSGMQNFSAGGFKFNMLRPGGGSRKK